MVKYLFKNGEFVKTALLPEDYPQLRTSRGESLPEIAVAGRSNVGKSSLLNDLFQAKGLVRTSSTPGKTQAINFFTLDKQLCFVDLPGYGYANVPLQVKKNWGQMIESYLNEREALKLILFLIDIRRFPTDEDFQMIEWIVSSELPFILILTKVDKVTSAEKFQRTEEILQALELQNHPFVHYSVPRHEGRTQLIHQIQACLN